jgi:hypothetical protein
LRDPPSRSRTNHNQPRADPIDRTGASPAAARAPFSRQFLSENRKLGYNARFANPQETSMRASAKPPVRNAAARFVRARHVFARLMDGQSMRDIAAAEGLSVRRVQQIVRAEIARREANPAEDYVLVQVARLERALELLGRQIDAGRAAAVPAFVRVIEQLGKLAGDPLRLPDPAFRPGGAVAALAERLARLDATREIVAERGGAAGDGKSAKRDMAQVSESPDNGEIADFADPADQ